MNILGIDICKNRAVCWFLSEEIPRNPRNYWKEKCKSDERSKDPDKDPLTFYFNRGGINSLLGLKPDAICLEPSGTHYAWLLVEVCTQHQIEVLWIGHQQASNHRKSYKLPDKNDVADAFAIACYAQLYYGQVGYFLEFNPGLIAEIREIYLQLKSLSRFQTPLISRLKQQLSREFPESLQTYRKDENGVADHRPSKKQKSKFGICDDGRRAFICWLAQRDRPGVRKSSYWSNRYSKAVGPDYGIQLSNFSRRSAAMIDDYDQWMHELTTKLAFLVHSPDFEAYNRVFDEFGFGLMLRACLLPLVFPFHERFESMGAFKRRIGCGLDEMSSGDKTSWKSGSGSKLARCELYLWASTTMTIKARRPQSEVGKQISEFYDMWQNRFSQNPEQWEREIKAKRFAESMRQLEEMLTTDVMPLLKKTQREGFKSKIEQLNQLLETDTEDLQLPACERVKKFSNLVLGKCVGYTARWLYRKLDRGV